MKIDRDLEENVAASLQYKRLEGHTVPSWISSARDYGIFWYKPHTLLSLVPMHVLVSALPCICRSQIDEDGTTKPEPHAAEAPHPADRHVEGQVGVHVGHYQVVQPKDREYLYNMQVGRWSSALFARLKL